MNKHAQEHVKESHVEKKESEIPVKENDSKCLKGTNIKKSWL